MEFWWANKTLITVIKENDSSCSVKTHVHVSLWSTGHCPHNYECQES